MVVRPIAYVLPAQRSVCAMGGLWSTLQRLKRKMPPKWQFEQALAAWFFPKAGTKMFMEAVGDDSAPLGNKVGVASGV